jgi:succinate dehydrogenase/fumarate reductase flavoprotein subunit
MERVHLETDLLVIGAGGAGMMAAITAAAAGRRVILADRSLIGRGGATIMAQMTVAVALGDDGPDDPQAHLADTLAAGRGLCQVPLSALLCEAGPAAIRQLDAWKVGWARHPDGRIKAAHAPGHDRARCVYVDFLSTGPALSKTLRAQVQRQAGIRRIGDLCITDIVVDDGQAVGAVGFSVTDGRPVSIAAHAVLVATGGLTRLYRRNSASANMGGDGYALALRAGADLIDMEFVQFFPIGHLAPRLIGMDPIMWDPFRYKLGGQLLNSEGRAFTDDYAAPAQGSYVITRDRATYAILKEVAAGRGSPSGGVYLSFKHVPDAALRAAFGPVIDKLAANGIDLTTTPIEVAPIAHYHMGGVKVTPSLETAVPNLFAIGEAVGGANGANRLSGNAVTEALVFGKHAALVASGRAAGALAWRDAAAEAEAALALVGSGGGQPAHLAALVASLQDIMADLVGPFRCQAGLVQALEGIAGLREAAGPRPPGHPAAFDLQRLDWFDLRNMLLVAEAVTTAALSRTESRGAHQRADYIGLDEAWTRNQVVCLRDGALVLQ